VSMPFVLPSLGDSVESAVITRWLKTVGDQVEADEPLLEVATDKVDTEITAPHAGIITELLADEDSVVADGAPLAVIHPADTSGDPDSDAATPTSTPEEVKPTTPPVAPAEPASTPAPNLNGDRTEKMTRLRRTIAARMVESLRVSAQLTTVVEADITALAHFRNQVKERFFADTGIKLSFLPFFVKAASEALAVHPVLNASLNTDSTEVTYHQARHLGIAVDAPRGLMVPVVRDTPKLSISGLAKEIHDLAERARNGTVTTDDLSGATFTITNTGSRGALFDTPIINQPQTGILGTGAVVERVVPRHNGVGGHNLAVASTVYLSLSYDHRIVDGADAARFLNTVRKRLETAQFATDL
jgi:2-oxoglutarate dehydrogenase E2 component (dihydrolipoamide succinyltransferase)